MGGSIWKAYFPEDGETPDDAVTLIPPKWRRIIDAETAAEFACEYDYGDRDGWERRIGCEFQVVIIAPDGAETRWVCHNEVTVEHHARAAEAE